MSFLTTQSINYRGFNMASSLSGYGPSKNLLFKDESDNYELWELKFWPYLWLQKLHNIVLETNGALQSVEPTADFTDKNAEVFATLVQLLDDKSIILIMRDAKNNGWKSLKILRDHYIGRSKPRIISMWCELTSLKLGCNENVTDFLLRAETCSSHLQGAGETVSDCLLISMILKRLPGQCKSITTVIIQQYIDKMTLSNFKSALKNFDENERSRSDYHKSESVLKFTA